MGSRVKNLALALPTAAVITKKIIVPAGQREDDLEMQVETEANQYIPFALDEVNLDFQILGAAPNNPDEIEVLIAASRKDKVEDRVAAAEAAGLKAVVVDVESFATQAATSPTWITSGSTCTPRPTTATRLSAAASCFVKCLATSGSISKGGGFITRRCLAATPLLPR